MPAYGRVAFGLVGRKLSHSWSPQIHATLGSSPYQLVELEPHEVVDFIRRGRWQGLNVTIPYKRDAAEAADVRSPRVQALGVANTLVHLDDGRVMAENTDALGFDAMLGAFCRRELDAESRDVLEGRKVLVLGTGGAAQAASYALRTGAGADVAFVSRTGDSTYDNLLECHGDAAFIVNATPVGMYPQCPSSPLAEGTLEQLPQLRGVIDVVYNPTRTGLVMQAERAGIPAESGLAMLVWQALFASELFQGKELDKDLVEAIRLHLLRSMANVSLIGMPGAGKTSTGRALAHMLGRPFVDLDDAFVMHYGTSPAACIVSEGEAAFRAKETETLAAYASSSGIVMACGGGVVTRPENYELLHQNGSIVMLDRPLDQLSTDGRPLSKSHGVEELARQRMDLYRGWADHIVQSTGTPAGDARVIVDMLGL